MVKRFLKAITSTKPMTASLDSWKCTPWHQGSCRQINKLTSINRINIDVCLTAMALYVTHITCSIYLS